MPDPLPLSPPRPAQPDELIAAVAERYGLTPATLVGHGGSPGAVVWARHELAWLLRQHTPLTFAAIGEIMGGRDATTSRHSVLVVESKATAQPAYREALADYTAQRSPAPTQGADVLTALRLILRSTVLTDSEARSAACSLLEAHHG